MIALWRLFFPLDVSHEEKYNEIQPSYKTMNQRHKVMRQIETGGLRLRKTFVCHQHGCTIRRELAIRKPCGD